MRDRRVVVPEATAMAMVASEMVGRRRTTRRAEGRSRMECMVIVHWDVGGKQLMLSWRRDHFTPTVRHNNLCVMICGLRGLT